MSDEAVGPSEFRCLAGAKAALRLPATLDDSGSKLGNFAKLHHHFFNPSLCIQPHPADLFVNLVFFKPEFLVIGFDFCLARLEPPGFDLDS